MLEIWEIIFILSLVIIGIIIFVSYITLENKKKKPLPDIEEETITIEVEAKCKDPKIDDFILYHQECGRGEIGVERECNWDEFKCKRCGKEFMIRDNRKREELGLKIAKAFINKKQEILYIDDLESYNGSNCRYERMFKIILINKNQ